ncbi:TrmH family RNA methyltransferase [Neisseria sp. HSC-16F19]|nr:RNA methyltransferase [Neisseria sp. HSC-16F19]MCP2040380.1 TrmH family RNA methyltransferase [Neisseria sp. HSC-16F19]
MQHITSPHNSALKQLAKLIRNRRERERSGMAVLEGVHLAESFIRAGRLPETLYVPAHRLMHPEVAALLAQVSADCVRVVADTALAKISSLVEADDIMMQVAIPTVARLPENEDCLVLERVQDPGNVGTILRSAAAAGIHRVVLDADCADVWSPKVLRAGMGAHAVLQVCTDVDLTAWRMQYRAPVYAAALGADALPLYDVDLRAPAAWLFGNEGSGLSAAALALADRHVLIPMAAGVESLNVAMAATVCVFEQQRQRRSMI